MNIIILHKISFSEHEPMLTITLRISHKIIIIAASFRKPKIFYEIQCDLQNDIQCVSKNDDITMKRLVYNQVHTSELHSNDNCKRVYRVTYIVLLKNNEKC